MKVLVAMSGGVDSSVAAFLMVRAGYDVTGITMRLREKPELKAVCQECGEHSCMGETAEDWYREEHDAARICEQLGIKHIVADFSREFYEYVVEPFIGVYEAGGTPNPCVECNKKIKFGKLLDFAIENGYDKLVTGHYARLVEINDGDGYSPDVWDSDNADGQPRAYALGRAEDEHKDQSYFLYGLTQYQLSHVIFPLGSLRKDEVRQLAEENGFVNAKKRDSQDICFVTDGDYVRVIEELTGKEYECGDFIGPEGKRLGGHKGIIRYTVGQRKGLGLALPEPLYVIEKDVVSNRVILGRNEELFSRELFSEGNNIIWEQLETMVRTGNAEQVSELCTGEAGQPSGGSETECFKACVLAKTRYSHHAQPAVAYITREKTTGTEEDVLKCEKADAVGLHVVFDEPQRAITPGQSVVIYSGDRVLGGGIIVSGKG